MKRIYIKPETLLILPYGQIVMEVTSGAPREIEGGPTSGSDGLPGTVGETGDDSDPYGDHGQGEGGSGNRSKSGMIWDEW